MYIRFRDEDGKLKTVQTKKITIRGSTRCQGTLDDDQSQKWEIFDEKH